MTYEYTYRSAGLGETFQIDIKKLKLAIYKQQSQYQI